MSRPPSCSSTLWKELSRDPMTTLPDTASATYPSCPFDFENPSSIIPFRTISHCSDSRTGKTPGAVCASCIIQIPLFTASA